MKTYRELLYQSVIISDLSSFKEEYNNFHLLLSKLQEVNLLCENEVRYFYESDFFKKEDVDFLNDIQERVLYHRLEENKIMNSKVKKGGFIKVANGSRIQGTVNVGGMQPDYIIDTRSIEIEKILRLVENETKNRSMDEQIDIVGNIVRKLIKRTEYDDEVYTSLLSKYKKLELEIPLSEYLKIERGVCREVALLTIIALNHIEIESYYYYAKVKTEFNGKEKLEDHAVVLVNKDNNLIIIDNYFRAFNKKSFEEFQQEDGIDVYSGLMYDSIENAKKGKAQIIMSRLYPENKHNSNYIKF